MEPISNCDKAAISILENISDICTLKCQPLVELKLNVKHVDSIWASFNTWKTSKVCCLPHLVNWKKHKMVGYKYTCPLELAFFHICAKSRKLEHLSISTWIHGVRSSLQERCRHLDIDKSLGLEANNLPCNRHSHCNCVHRHTLSHLLLYEGTLDMPFLSAALNVA